MKVAALQMVSATTVQANLERAGLLLAQAAEAGAELAVLPEYFCLLGRRDTDKLAVQEAPGQGPIQDFLAAQARKLGLWIVGGTLPLSSDQPGRVRNSSLVWSPTGEPASRHSMRMSSRCWRSISAASMAQELGVGLLDCSACRLCTLRVSPPRMSLKASEVSRSRRLCTWLAS